MKTSEWSPRLRGEALLEGLLVAWIVLPAFAILWGTEAGRVVFVLYREPKLVVLQILGWFLLFAFLVIRGPWLAAHGSSPLDRPAFRGLLLLFAWWALGRFWVRVPENHFYEFNQYLLLVPALWVLLVWARGSATLVGRVEVALLGSLGALTLVGLYQGVRPIPWLLPINPEVGALNPSFMGYKNPMALAVLAQIFLLAGRVAKNGRWWSRLLWGALLILEVVYLADLGSRTTWAAVLVALGFLIFLILIGPEARGRRPRFLAMASLVLLLLVGGLAMSESTRDRFGSLLVVAASPSAFLESDRGTYLRNTLHMVSYHPWGVGLGDWQTHYPVYRLHQRSVAFTEFHQVRRAHSDHVQTLGEGGWLGLTLWLFVLGAALWEPLRRYLASGERRELFLATQMVALGTAMATDYVVELPYAKFQFFLLLFLVLAPRKTERLPVTDHKSPHWVSALAVGALLVALSNSVLHGQLVRKMSAAAHLTRLYVHTTENPQDLATRARFLDRARTLESRIVGSAGHTKTLFRDYFVLGQAARLLGHPEIARRYGWRSLDLYPYSPSTFRLMAAVGRTPGESKAWDGAWHYVMHVDTSGYTGPYPPRVLD